jgi:2-amino-4-hydroxy-6-hydroxymethyldihydropteridine diphosphokinase
MNPVGTVVERKRDRWYPAYVGLGSNLQGPATQVQTAFELIGAMPATRLIARSSLYRSAPYGGVEQPDFVNAVAALLTQLSARQLLSELKQIETRRGRDSGEVRWGPRVLDLDLLVYGGDSIADNGLTVPHPGIAERNFVLLPLLELAPELVIPGIGRLASLPVNTSEPLIEKI